MRYDFIVDTYATERVKVLGAWSMFTDQDLRFRPHTSDPRGRSLLEQMIHQCVSEDLWFRNILGIDVNSPPLPAEETRIGFILRYEEDSAKRHEALKQTQEAWWEEVAQFFDVERTRAWIMMRRIAHTAHHRGQQTALLRMLKHDLHSTYGPTRRYRWSDAESGPHNLCLLERPRTPGRRSSREQKASSTGIW